MRRLTLQRRGWKILFEPAAQAFTEAPETVRAFVKQRFRWVFGTLQVAHKHAAAVLSRKALGVALITIPNVYIFQIGYSLLAPLMDAALLLDSVPRSCRSPQWFGRRGDRLRARCRILAPVSGA